MGKKKTDIKATMVKWNIQTEGSIEALFYLDEAPNKLPYLRLLISLEEPLTEEVLRRAIQRHLRKMRLYTESVSFLQSIKDKPINIPI